MYRQLFSPHLNRGYELQIFWKSVLVMLVLTMIGLVAAYFLDAGPNSFFSAFLAILATTTLWFWVVRKYRFFAALSIATGGFFGFFAVFTWGTGGWSTIVLGVLGLLTVLRYYSEGPMGI